MASFPWLCANRAKRLRRRGALGGTGAAHLDVLASMTGQKAPWELCRTHGELPQPGSFDTALLGDFETVSAGQRFVRISAFID
jgi:hypothetical protein